MWQHVKSKILHLADYRFPSVFECGRKPGPFHTKESQDGIPAYAGVVSSTGSVASCQTCQCTRTLSAAPTICFNLRLDLLSKQDVGNLISFSVLFSSFGDASSDLQVQLHQLVCDFQVAVEKRITSQRDVLDFQATCKRMSVVESQPKSVIKCVSISFTWCASLIAEFIFDLRLRRLQGCDTVISQRVCS